MPLHTPTVRYLRVAGAAAFVTACIAAGAATVAIADDRPIRDLHPIAERRQPETTRYVDIEANKATSMRALGLHIAERRAQPAPRYHDLEANKARSQRAR
jgi:hypothetical protein